MKKNLIVIITSLFLVSLIVGMQVTEVAKANPYYYTSHYELSITPIGTNPPIVSIYLPNNNSILNSGNIVFSFNAALPQDNNFNLSLGRVYYKASWQSENTNISSTGDVVRFSDIPQGNCSLKVYAEGFNIKEAYRRVQGVMVDVYYTKYRIIAHSTVYFTVDSLPPNISNISIENKTYSSTTLPLKFNTNELTPQIFYSLDKQTNTTIATNTTLSGLNEGSHNLVIYANDTAGNIGKSQTVYFTINIPPSPTPIITPSITPSNFPTQQPTIEPALTATITPTCRLPPSNSFPLTTTIIAIMSVVCVGALGVLIYFKKVKK